MRRKGLVSLPYRVERLTKKLSPQSEIGAKMIYRVSAPFAYEVRSIATCCGEIQRVRAVLMNIIKAAKAYAAEHSLEDRETVVTGVALL